MKNSLGLDRREWLLRLQKSPATTEEEPWK